MKVFDLRLSKVSFYEVAKTGARLLVFLFILNAFNFGQDIVAKVRFSAQDFPLVYQKQRAGIFVSDEDFKVVKIAAADFVSDVEKVSDQKLKVVEGENKLPENLVLVGTLGKNSLIDNLIRNNRLDVSKIEKKWESFQIEVIKNPFPRVEKVLIVVGSDRRGTAFGVYELSQRIGVSPWVWWADVTPDKRQNLIISKGKLVSREPSVKYRGIFLNDEDWGLQPWAAKTFEPESDDIGPKTYAKIFELLLRLKANACWPAMHEVTRPFNENPKNAQTADDYAIVMGSSHAEPMLRNNVGEWKSEKEKYNFNTNPEDVTNYWGARLKTNGKYENIFTLGMRGIHDSPIQGPRNQLERIDLLEKIIAVQRNLLEKNSDQKIENLPQIFCPYKEVLADYKAGLRVPEDVTIVFPDDNFGYIRHFPNSFERKRKGGFGVYYHISYLGRPFSYLWLNTAPPALIWEEMSKAFENGMQKFWMLNAGDIKPAEIGIELFMQMAYDAKKWRRENLKYFLQQWARREFGGEYSLEIARLMDRYYRLGFQRKPEHLQWHLPKETPAKSDLTETEILDRLEDYNDLHRRADDVYNRISATKKDAFYELVLYPVRAAAFANERFFAAELAENYRQTDATAARKWAGRSIAAQNEIERETAYFNERLANGKWRLMMSPEMKAGQWPSMRTTPPKIAASDYPADSANSKSTFNFERRKKPSPAISPRNSRAGFIEVNGIISMEAENFTRHSERNGFSWQIIEGLGKTGDSVSVFPQIAKTFENLTENSPSLEYHFTIVNDGQFEANFLLIPTQPLISGSGLRFAVSLDGQPPELMTVDKETEVSSRKWLMNILNQSTVGKHRFNLNKGRHVLKIFAVDTGVILDKIVFYSGRPELGYFLPAETINR